MTVSIRVSRKEHLIEPGLIKGSEIFKLASLAEDENLYLEQDKEIDIPIDRSDFLVIRGNEEFSTSVGASKIENNPCLRKPIELSINDIELKGSDALKRPKISGQDLMKIDPQVDVSQSLFIDIPGLPDERINKDQVLILQHDMQFITTPCGNVGDSNPILESQLAEVKKSYPKAELYSESQSEFALVIRDFPIPELWSQDKVELLITINKGFPLVPLDMFYVYPDLKLSNGTDPQCAQVKKNFLQKTWQRFSWHYKSRPWNPNLDSLLSHIRFCQSRLAMAS